MYYILFIIILIIAPASAQWIIQDSGVTVTLRDVCFVDSLHGWAVGDSATIIATTNGGDTWKRQKSPVKDIRLRKVIFFNKDIGYIIGDNQDQSSSPKGFILATNNGGRIWTVRKGDIDFLMEDLSFINPDTGWVVGSAPVPLRSNSVLLHTVDGGKTWHVQLQTKKYELLVSVAFIDSQNGWLLGGPFLDPSAMHVYRTETGGRHWEIVNEIQVPVIKLRVASQDTLWAGWLGFARSDDGGFNWFEKSWSAYYVSGIWDIDPINGKKGWIVASYLISSNSFASRILFTRDGGQNWKILLDAQKPPLYALASAGKKLWVVGGAAGARSDNYGAKRAIILHNRDFTTSVRKPANEIPKVIRLEQNFPNPFNSSTVIRFTLHRHELTTLAVYNIRGEKVAVLISEELGPGSYSVRWDCTDARGQKVASGIYFYRLEVMGAGAARAFSASRKLVVLE